MYLLILIGLTLFISALTVLLLSRKKRSKPILKKGDYVMLRGRFKREFPGVPTSHALVIEQLQEGKATVVFMNVNNQILKQIIPLYALARAS